MKTATFENTVDILVKAYLNDTLRHGECTACAVGNIITGSGYDLQTDKIRCDETQWLLKIQKDIRRNVNWNYNSRVANDQINSTGYDILDLDKIEYAFESAYPVYPDNDRMYAGLMSVVDVLAEIHNVDLSVRESAKQLFVKA